MKLIDKDALVVEIEKRVGFNKALNAYSRADECNAILSFLDTFGVKEVNLQSEIDRVWDNTSDNFSEDGWKEFEDIAKHFFDLGLRASNPLTWEDINSILYIERLVLREFGGQEHSNEELCREVLKRFKETKKVD